MGQITEGFVFHVKKLEFVNVSDGKSPSRGSSWLDRHFRVIVGFAVSHCGASRKTS